MCTQSRWQRRRPARTALEHPLFLPGTKEMSLFWRGEVGLGGGLGGEGAGVRVGAGCSGGGGVDPSARTLVASTRCWNVCWKLFMIKNERAQ